MLLKFNVLINLIIYTKINITFNGKNQWIYKKTTYASNNQLYDFFREYSHILFYNFSHVKFP